MSAAKASASAMPVDDKRRAHEPTMEEILASIRRIISDDQNARNPTIGPEPQEPLEPETSTQAAQDQTYVDSREDFSAQNVSAQDDFSQNYPAEDRQESLLRRLKASSEAQSRGAFRQAAEILETAERELAPLATPGAEVDSPGPTPPYTTDMEHLSPLLSATTAAAIAAQFETLAVSRLFGEDGRMEGIVKQMLRPLLREWLDVNLPGIVEKLVRAEIERVARGGRN